MPALPAFVLLVGGDPAARPDARRPDGCPGSRRSPVGSPGRRATAVVVAVPRARPARRSPRIVDPLRSPRNGRRRRADFVSSEVIVDDIGVPTDDGVVSLDRAPARAAQTSSPGRTRRAGHGRFYRVYRASPSRGFPDTVCELRGVDVAASSAPRRSTTTRARPTSTRDPPPDATYRIGVAANWLDDPEQGDVFAFSPPVAPSAGERDEPFRTAVAIVPVYIALCVFSEGGLITDSLWGDVGHYEGFGRRILDGDVPYGDFSVEYPPFALPAFVAPALVTSTAPDYLFVFKLMMTGLGVVVLLATGYSLGRLGAGRTATLTGLGTIALAPLLLGHVFLEPVRPLADGARCARDRRIPLPPRRGRLRVPRGARSRPRPLRSRCCLSRRSGSC